MTTLKKLTMWGVTGVFVALASACYWEAGVGWTWDGWNHPPEVYDGEAGCYWDAGYQDYVWYFDATVDDWDGPYDVRDVWAHVYETGPYGDYVDSFELYRAGDPHGWFSDWLESSTWLSCAHGAYNIEVEAWDYSGLSDAHSVPIAYDVRSGGGGIGR